MKFLILYDTFISITLGYISHLFLTFMVHKNKTKFKCHEIKFSRSSFKT